MKNRDKKRFHKEKIANHGSRKHPLRPLIIIRATFRDRYLYDKVRHRRSRPADGTGSSIASESLHVRSSVFLVRRTSDRDSTTCVSTVVAAALKRSRALLAAGAGARGSGRGRKTSSPSGSHPPVFSISGNSRVVVFRGSAAVTTSLVDSTLVGFIGACERLLGSGCDPV